MPENPTQALPQNQKESPADKNWRPHAQVDSQHYRFQYDDWDKWVSYYWQIRSVMERGLRKVLEIGVGSRVVSSYLMRNAVDLVTLDIDATVRPGVLASATELPFPDNTFDGVICAEVLEHMPFAESCRAIRELHRVTRSCAFVTVPHFTLSFALLLRAPVLHLHEFRLRIPYPKKIRRVGLHHWECGKRGYPVSRLRREFVAAGFRVVSEERPPTNYSHCFFVLEKTSGSGRETS